MKASTGVVAFLQAPDFENPTDLDRNNSYVVVVRASSGGQSSMQTITVNVTNVNEPPRFTSNGGSGVALLGITENSQAVTVLEGFDPDASTILAFRISGGADADKFSLDVATRGLAFVAPPDFEKHRRGSCFVDCRAWIAGQ